MNSPQSLYIIEVTNIDFLGGSDGKASAYNVGDLGSIPGVGKLSWRRVARVSKQKYRMTT